jgi:hypothetical protein
MRVEQRRFRRIKRPVDAPGEEQLRPLMRVLKMMK